MDNGNNSACQRNPALGKSYAAEPHAAEVIKWLDEVVGQLASVAELSKLISEKLFGRRLTTADRDAMLSPDIPDDLIKKNAPPEGLFMQIRTRLTYIEKHACKSKDLLSGLNEKL